MVVEDVYAKLLDVIKELGNDFTTYDVIMGFKRRYEGDFFRLVERYGCEGGKGSGRRYTPYVYIGKQISNLARKGWLLEMGWREEEDWSAPKVRRWRINPRILLV
ncbi:MAG: hypothetical protein ACPLPS_01570 [bacterium]